MKGLSAITLCRRSAYQLELLKGKAGYWHEISIAHGQDCYLSSEGVILAYSYREEPYKSFMETVEIVHDNLGTSS